MKPSKKILAGSLIFAGLALTSCDNPFFNPCLYGPGPTNEVTTFDPEENTAVPEYGAPFTISTDEPINTEPCVYGPAPTDEVSTFIPEENVTPIVYGAPLPSDEEQK